VVGTFVITGLSVGSDFSRDMLLKWDQEIFSGCQFSPKNVDPPNICGSPFFANPEPAMPSSFITFVPVVR
jgi:hypothetical protein